MTWPKLDATDRKWIKIALYVLAVSLALAFCAWRWL